jgi:glycosyltransferase involved in cell wall biosynthesis
VLRVSVIVPAYNRADYLSLALASVLHQSRQPSEIIVVDDGSEDNTPELVRGFGSRVRYVRHEQNRGVSEARNTGLEAAQGEVIAWLDADDLWEADYLQTVLPILEADEAVDGVYTGLVRMDADGNLLPQSSQVAVPPSELRSALAEECFIQTSTLVARRACFDLAGRFDPRFDICEDYDMFLRLAETCTIVGLPVPLVRYRVHEHNTVANVAAFCRFRLALTQKHYGEPEGDPETWPPDKRRAHGHAFRAAALKCIEAGQTEEGWSYLERAVSIWPNLLRRLDTFYELACGDQPMGYRGQADLLDIERNGTDMIHRLDTLFSALPTLEPWRRPAYGNAYLALGSLSDQAGRWGHARRYMIQALKADPSLLASPLVARRFLKLCAGQRLVRLGQSVRRQASARRAGASSPPPDEWGTSKGGS